ncbi:MAG: hypothetical protein VYC34_06280, partial [Planctomycetota bacterium]|nr:hypothetical protein [Planctomycetota bacterium]
MSRINAAETAALARALAQSTRETARPLNISGIIRGASVETAQPAAVDPADLDPRRASRLGPDPNAALKGISDAIRKIEALVNERLSAPNPPADALAAAQSQIDALLDGVSAIADDFDFENLDFFAEGRAWRLREPVANVRDIALFDGAPAPGDTLDVNVTVVQSAQPAGLFLHLGAGSLDLDGPDGQFTIEIAG